MTGYTPDQFKAWQRAMGWKNYHVAHAFSCNLQRVSKMRKSGCDMKTAMACRALALGAGHAKHEVKYPWEHVSLPGADRVPETSTVE